MVTISRGGGAAAMARDWVLSDKSESDEKMAVVNPSRWPFLFAAVSAAAASTLEHYRRANSGRNSLGAICQCCVLPRAVLWPVQSFAKRSALRFEFLAYDGGAGAQCLQLAAGDFTGERGHAAVCAGVKLVGIHELQRLAQGLGDLFRRLDGVVGDIDGANHDLLATD